MTEKALSESLKDSGIGVTEISSILGISRQTVYNYLQYYEDGDIEKIPNVVFRVLEMCSQENMNKEAKEYWNRETCDIANMMGRMKALQDRLARLEEEYRKLLDGMNSVSDPSVMKTVTYREREIAKELQATKAELAHIDMKIQTARKNLMNSTASGRDSQIIPARGKRGNPIWKGTDIQTICISDDREHMVIVKDAESSALTIVEIYALIDDTDVLIEKHEIPRGSNNIRINLIPKLNYSYRVIRYTDDGVKSTGMMELKNYFRKLNE